MTKLQAVVQILKRIKREFDDETNNNQKNQFLNMLKCMNINLDTVRESLSQWTEDDCTWVPAVFFNKEGTITRSYGGGYLYASLVKEKINEKIYEAVLSTAGRGSLNRIDDRTYTSIDKWTGDKITYTADLMCGSSHVWVRESRTPGSNYITQWGNDYRFGVHNDHFGAHGHHFGSHHFGSHHLGSHHLGPHNFNTQNHDNSYESKDNDSRDTESKSVNIHLPQDLPIPGINHTSVYSTDNPLNNDTGIMNLKVIRRPLEGTPLTPFTFGILAHSAILCTDGRGNQKIIEMDKNDMPIAYMVRDYVADQETKSFVASRFVRKIEVLKKTPPRPLHDLSLVSASNPVSTHTLITVSNPLTSSYMIDDGVKERRWTGQKLGVDVPGITFEEIENIMKEFSKGKYHLLNRNCHKTQQAALKKVLEKIKE